jgi:hypothetical protein
MREYTRKRRAKGKIIIKIKEDATFCGEKKKRRVSF